VHINFDSGEFVSVLTDILGFKAGLVVAPSRLEGMKATAPSEIQVHWPVPSTAPVRMRAEEFQAIVSWLLFRVGALPQFVPGAHERLLAEQTAAPPQLQATYRLVLDAMAWHVKDQTLQRVARGINPFTSPEPLDAMPWIEECATKGGLAAFELALKIVGYVNHDAIAFSWNRIRRIQWKDEVDLDALFRDAGFDPIHGHFFDQRYIDYLSTNAEEVGAIHWRQFERLTAEFFTRHGYNVDLGPGRGDGGVDVRVWRAGGSGPPLMLIQCKRQKDVVEQVYVKALYADVLDEKAASGLLVTTSRLEPCAARWCAAHSYKIDSAERPKLRTWIEQLRTSEAEISFDGSAIDTE
jgi:restriction system protein